MLKWLIGVLLALPMIMGMEPAKASERVLLAPPPTAKSAASSTSFAKETTPGTIRNLRAQIGRAKDGRARVIVGYRVPFAPEARLNPQERAQQQKEIAAAGKSLRRAFAAADKRGKGINAFDSIPFAAMEVTQKELDRLLADPNVLTIAEDAPTLPQLTYSVPLIGAPPAWIEGATGAGQTVAVLEQGAQTGHPFLRDPATAQSKVVYEAACNGGKCRPGKGMAERGSRGGDSHGTSVSGIIVGQRAASAAGKDDKLTGVAPGARLIVMSGLFQSDFISAFEKVYELRNQYNIAAVNFSIGFADSNRKPIVLDPLECSVRYAQLGAIISNLREAGIVTVISAGNNGDPSGHTGNTARLMAPACLPMAVSVGAVFPSQLTGTLPGQKERFRNTVYPCGNFRQQIVVDEVSCFSNTSPNLTLLAPGYPTETSGLDGTYNLFFGGTSAAAPHVAAAFAALRSKVPNATVSQMLEALRATGKPVRDYRTGLVTPRIQIDKALEHLQKTAQPSIDYIARGDGSGTVSFAPGGSLTTCSKDCTNAYPAGTRVTMTARPQAGMRFEGWSGAGSSCGRAETCALTVSGAVKVQANFMNPDAPVKLDYSASGNGSGTIRVHGAGPASETCSAASCSFNYPRGTEVRVNVRADAGSTLTSLTHGQSGASTRFACTDGWCAVTLSQNTQVQASFARSPAPKPSFTLSYSRGGTGTGTLSASVGGQPVACAGASCSTRQPEGTLVTLSAAASGNSNFSGWSGACSGSAPTCTLTMRADASVVGTFQPRPGNNNVTLSYLRTGSGTISASVDGTSTTCAASCTITRPAGTLVTLTAQPGPGAVFAGWSGSCRGTAPTCTVNLRAGGVALATFQNRPRTTASSQ